jgi:hypothetical protein
MWITDQWCSPISRDQGQHLGHGPRGEVGEILNGDVTYLGPVQVLVDMPGPGSAERHDSWLGVCRGTGGYSSDENAEITILERGREVFISIC